MPPAVERGRRKEFNARLKQGLCRMKSGVGSSERIVVTGGSGFIGTNLVGALIDSGASVLSLDIAPPRFQAHLQNYRYCDLLDRQRLERTISEFSPAMVLHLAARTDLVESGGLQAYAANIEGVENVLKAVASSPSIRRVLFTSSKLVNKNGEITDRTTSYTPNTLYGQSKVLGEQIVRDAPPDCEWAILRPTSIWGPWFDVPYRAFFRSVANHTYFHLTGCDLPKRFGYVGNTVDQILSLIQCPAHQIQGETFYLADYYTTSIRRWADEISVQLRGTPNPSAPDWLVNLAARAGDVAKSLGMANPPLSSFRLRNLCTPTADVPLDNIAEISGPLRFSEADGVRLTLKWLGKL
jgi:GlcNAc-P-P-Und epimerase